MKSQRRTLTTCTLTMPRQMPNCDRGDRHDGCVRRCLLLKMRAKRLVLVSRAARQTVKLKLTPMRMERHVTMFGLIVSGQAQRWHEQMPERRK